MQRRFARRLFGRNTPNNDDRLKLLKIPSLVLRKNTADMIFIFKLLHNPIDIDPESIGKRLLKMALLMTVMLI